MRVTWTGKALGDLARLHAFLVDINPAAAANAVLLLTGAVDKLPNHPRLGLRLEEFNPTEVRRMIVGQYEIRYALDGEAIHILRLWSTREDR